MSVQVVRTVGRYEIVREIGRGGMAVVYLARQTDLDRLVALKELAAFRASDADVVERFLRESRLAGSLNHPNIVTVHEYFEHDGTAFIAMEYFERGSLRPLVGRVSPAQAGGVLEGLLAGLAHAERRGIVHRDLKPENVMVTAEGGVKIADFGIAKAVQGPAARTLTDAGAAVGTPAYMAPELVTGGEVGPWTDLYGLGVTAFELLAGRLPFDDDDLALALMLRHASEPAPPLRSFRPDLDHALCGWVDGLLAKTAAERPSNATDAAEELDEIMIAWLGPRWRRQARLTEGGLPVTGQPRGSETPIADAVATPELTPPSRRLPRRGRLAAAGVVVAALAALAAAILLVGGSDEPRAAAKPVPDLVPRPADRLGAEAAGRRAFVSDPAGRIVALDRATLAVSETLRDPAHPRAVAFARGAVLVADDQGVSALDAESLAPRAARALPGASLLAASQGMAAVAARGGQVCVVGAGLRLDPCARVPFAPAGLGVDGEGRVYVANAGAGTVLQYRASQRGLVRAGRAVPVGPGAHGRLLVHRGLLYVAVRRGIAVVDPVAGQPRTVRLPVTPSDLWLSGSGRLFAALPGLDRVAVVDAGADAAPRLVRAVQNPVALAGAAAGPVLVVGADGALADSIRKQVRCWALGALRRCRRRRRSGSSFVESSRARNRAG